MRDNTLQVVVTASSRIVELGELDEFPEEDLWAQLEESSCSTLTVVAILVHIQKFLKCTFANDSHSKGGSLRRYYCQQRRLLALLNAWRNHVDHPDVILVVCDILLRLTMSTFWIKDYDHQRAVHDDDDSSTCASAVNPTAAKQQLPTTIPRSRFLVERGFIDAALEAMERHGRVQDIQRAALSLLLHWCYNDRFFASRRHLPIVKHIVDALLVSIRNHKNSLEITICAFQLIGNFLSMNNKKEQRQHQEANALLGGKDCMELLAAFVRHIPVVDSSAAGHALYDTMRLAIQSARLRSAMVDLGGIRVLQEVVHHANHNANQDSSCFCGPPSSKLLHVLDSDWKQRRERIQKSLSNNNRHREEVVATTSNSSIAPNTATTALLMANMLARESDSASALFYCLQSSAAEALLPR